MYTIQADLKGKIPILKGSCCIMDPVASWILLYHGSCLIMDTLQWMYRKEKEQEKHDDKSQM